MDASDGILILLAVFVLGAYWALPNETIYQALVTITAALIGVGWLSSKKKKKKH